jgi:glycerol uptake facilitator protein
VETTPLTRSCQAEALGTFILVFLGTGAVFVAVLTGALAGLFQVAIVWGIGVGLAIHAVGAVSGAHLNPAVTIALCLFRGFPKPRVVPYILAQLMGAFLASCVLYALFSGVLAGFEKEHGIQRGLPGSQQSAMVFGEYTPNPAIFGTDAPAHEKVTLTQAFAAEFIGTALLLFMIFALTDPDNSLRPERNLFAAAIGLTVTALICLLSPLTQAGFNPARDLGPRLFSYLAGWGGIAIPGPRGEFFTVYILAPILGAVTGAAAYERGLRPT